MNLQTLTKKLTDQGVFSVRTFWIVVGLVGAGIAVAGWQGGWFSGRGSGPRDLAGTAAGAEPAGVPTIVELTAEKFRFAKISDTEVVSRPIQEIRTVPGRITYDGAKHLEVTAPVDCVIRKVLCEPGQVVEAGAQLALLSSAELGRARDEVMRAEDDLRLARREHEWAEEIYENVEELLKGLAEHPTLKQVEEQLEMRALGDYREKLVAAYSKLLLAEAVTISTDELENKGTLSRRVIEERRSNREIAAATFKGACESAHFEAMRDHSRAHAAEQQCERLLAIRRDHLATLLGPQGSLLDPILERRVEGENASENKTSSPHSVTEIREGALSEFLVRAPFDGRIEERHVVGAARVAAGKPLFSLADTSTLWVEAEIHERDWRALEHAAEGAVMIRVPALNDAEFPTKLRFVGARVSAETRSVPMVVELANESGKFKPGLFVWVDVPLESQRDALVVPAGAIMRHEEKPFVFVPAGENTYRRVDVQLGLETPRGVEIVSGLEKGQRVVHEGAFFLKSELLLEKEAD